MEAGEAATQQYAAFPAPVRMIILFIDRVFDVVLSALVAFFVCIIFIQVILRYFFKTSLIWADEISVFAFVWMVFLASAIAIGRSYHIAVTVVFAVAPSWARRTMLYVATASFVALGIVLIVAGSKIIMISGNAIAPASRLPMSYVQLIFPIFGLITIYRCIVLTAIMFKTGREEAP